MSRSSTPPVAARARAFALARPCAFAVSCVSTLLSGLHPVCASAQSMSPVVVTATRSEIPIEGALADVTVIDALVPGYGGNLFNVEDVRDRIHLIVDDVRDAPAIESCVEGRDYVFNLVGQVSHTDSMSEPTIDLGGTSPLADGDTFLLCSDGLWAYFSDAELGGVLAAHPPRAAAEILIQRARDRASGHGDNCSLVIVKLVEKKAEKKPAAAVPPGFPPPKA